MRERRRVGVARGAAGFTLVELLVSVAIIGLLSSIAVPALQRAVHKSKRNAATADLRQLKDSLHAYARDAGGYPKWGALNLATLAPLDKGGFIKNPKTLLRGLTNKRLIWYYPWNFLDDPYTPAVYTNPDSFIFMAQLDYDPDIQYIVTDRQMYYYIRYQLIPIDDLK